MSEKDETSSLQSPENRTTLREPKYQYHLLVQHSPDVISNLDRQGTILFINHTLPQYTVESVIGTNISKYHSEADASRFLRLLEKMFDLGEPQSLEVVAAGPTHWLTRIFPIQQAGEVVSALVIATDITRQKEMEQALMESNELNHRIVEAVSGGIILVAVNGAISRANQEAQRILGLSFDQLTGSYVADFETKTIWEDGTLCESKDYPVSKCLATGMPQSGVTLGVRRPDGITAWAIFSAIPIKDPMTGAVSGAVVTFVDISDRKKVEVELQNSRQQLRDFSTRLQSTLEEERSRISREIHDELGQQLTILKMELSHVNKRLSKSQGPLRERMNSMTRLVESTIQTVRKISTEMRPGVLDDLGLTAAMEWQVGEFKKRTGIRALFTTCPEEITLDPGRSTAIFRIFQETLTNVVRHAGADQIKVHLERTKAHLIMEVTDNGRGITEEQIANSNSLGLLGIRERVLLWGGTVQIHGIPQRGTTLRVTIPLSLPGEAEEAPSSPDAAGSIPSGADPSTPLIAP